MFSDILLFENFNIRHSGLAAITENKINLIPKLYFRFLGKPRSKHYSLIINEDHISRHVSFEGPVYAITMPPSTKSQSQFVNCATCIICTCNVLWFKFYSFFLDIHRPYS